MSKYILLTVLIGLIGNSIYSQPIFKDEIKSYDHICFCNVGLSHPMEILDMDNNMEILFALKTGQTLYELEKVGVKFKESQINLMELSGLIAKKDSICHTIIPILSRNETIQLHEKTKKMAKDIILLFNDEYGCFYKTLDSKGLQRNSYSLFFAFVLDGLVWDILEKDSEIEETKITKEKPFWDGTFWMITPKREFSFGTNSLSSGDFSISLNWSDLPLCGWCTLKFSRIRI